jgi:alpha-glucuronidase
MIQVKNGPIDFQPREPFHPIFGAMPKTPLMMEFQITQEYLGQGTHLVYLAPMWKEVLEADTYSNGRGSTVSSIIDGSLEKRTLTGMAGVANIGNDLNWTGHLFGQANWYAFGRLAWNPYLNSHAIAEEWLRMTFSNNKVFVNKATQIMLSSHETCVNYMTPLGLHHIMATGHHYGPGPWVDDQNRPEWNPVYYHQADVEGIGFDRTPSGSDAVSQYSNEVAIPFSNSSTCPDKYLLWFHRVKWNFKISSGQTLWEELCRMYYKGAAEVTDMRKTWHSLGNYIDLERFTSVDMLLSIQEKEAIWWRNACLLYFQSFAEMPIPPDLEQPDKTLDYYMKLDYPYAPGIRPRW